MQDTVCLRCGRSGLVRFETVLKAGIAYKMFYCGRCEYTWQSGRVAHSTQSLDKPGHYTKQRPTKHNEFR